MNSHRWSLLLLCSAVFAVPAAAQDWPQWRGPNRDGNVTAVGMPQT